MYDRGVVGGASVAAGGTLPFTGFEVVWLVLAAFALLMVAGAIWRIVPRTQA
jgi:hypothetical protein